MAQRVRTILVDDIEGTEIKEGGETISFGYRGVNYQIDLNDENAKKFDEAMDFYLTHATRLGGRKEPSGTSSTRTDKAQLDAMRSWARENGHQVSSRGRISKAVREAYQAAH
ncbi:MAG: Lsr2 family protein [Ornithinimicrobium sp.]